MQETGQKQLNGNAAAIQNEYRRLDSRWRRMQYQACLWIVLCTTAMELLLFFVLHEMNEIEASVPRYLVKYLIAPFLVNVLLLTFADLVQKNSRVSEEKKVYCVSLTVTLVVFVIYTVHCVFSALSLTFSVPIIMTVVYGDHRLTSLVSIASVTLKALSDLLIFWDASKVSVFSSNMSAVNFALSILLLLATHAVCMLLIRIEQDKNSASIRMETERQRLQEEAVTDPLTGIGNRQGLRAMFQQLEGENAPWFLAMMDLDDFKNLNDTYGHTCGDNYLTAFGAVLREHCRHGEYPFRFGGDEFCILLREKTEEEATAFCRELQQKFSLAQQALECSRPVTISMGIARHQEGDRPSELLQRADTALYQAKQEKDCVFCAQSKEEM